MTNNDQINELETEITLLKEAVSSLILKSQTQESQIKELQKEKTIARSDLIPEAQFCKMVGKSVACVRKWAVRDQIKKVGQCYSWKSYLDMQMLKDEKKRLGA